MSSRSQGRSYPKLGPARSLALVLFTFLTLTLVQVAVPLRLERMGVGGMLLGVLLALPSVTGLAAETPFASLSDVVGRRQVISFGAMVLVGASVLLATVSSLWLFTAALILYGVGLGALTSALMAALSESVPPERSAHLQGLNGAVQRFGAMGVAGLVAVSREPRGLLWSVGVAGVACLALSAAVPHWRFAGRQRPRFRFNYGAAFGLLRRSRLVQVGAMYNVLLTVLFTTTNSFVALILVTTGSPLHLAVLLVVRDLTSVIVAPLFGPLAKRLGWQRCFLAGMLSGLASMSIGIAVSPSSPWMYLLFVLCGLATGFGIAGANLAVTYGTEPGERALGMVASGYSGRVAAFVVPVGLAYAFSQTASIGVFAVATTAAVMTVGRALWLLRQQRITGPPHQP